MARGRDRALIEEHAATLADDERSRLQERVLDAALPSSPELERAPDWLAAADARVPSKPLPSWVDIEALPALEVEGGSLGPTHLPAVLRILRAGDPATERLRTYTGAEDLAWTLFGVWLRSDAPSKDKWAFAALGALGGDRTATQLAPLIRAWPGEGQHKRAMAGLEILRAIGTDVALMQLNGIAQKLKFKALKDGARQAMEEIARDKQMSKSELEDRIVPDCGLDAQGTRIFDYGARRFEFVLGPAMKPMVRDAAGTVRAAPPKPGAKDDAARATAALEDWKLLRKTVADVAKVQAARLEQAMIAGRRWSGDDFMTLLAGHPLQRHLVRPLVLATYRAGAVEATFRLTEEGDLADAQDEPFALASESQVGIVHPLDLDSGQLATWGEHLADYELVPPFPQLGRAVFDIEPDERTEPMLTRFNHAQIEPATLVRTLENLDWTRGQPQDGGIFSLHTKYFPGADCTAVVEYRDGVPTGYIHEAEPQRITHVYIVGGELNGGQLGWGWHDGHDDPVPWGAVDRNVRSEVLADVHQVMPP